MWKYESSTGKLFDPDGNLKSTGYSGGDKGLHKEGINNPALQSEHNIGPLPEGLYEMGIPVEGSHLGPFAIPLIPNINNQMFGRSGFYIHGDRIGAEGTASDGCIILARSIRGLLWDGEDHALKVIANYLPFNTQ